MRRAVAVPYAQRDFPALAASLQRLVELNPARTDTTWRDWDRHALAAATAAQQRDQRRGVRSCAACHVMFRRPYVERYRARPVD